MLVILDEPQTTIWGGTAAAPVFRSIALAAAERLGVAVDPPAEDEQGPAPPAELVAGDGGKLHPPSFLGLSMREAIDASASASTWRSTWSAAATSSQDPPPGAPLAADHRSVRAGPDGRPARVMLLGQLIEGLRDPADALHGDRSVASRRWQPTRGAVEPGDVVLRAAGLDRPTAADSSPRRSSVARRRWRHRTRRICRAHPCPAVALPATSDRLERDRRSPLRSSEPEADARRRHRHERQDDDHASARSASGSAAAFSPGVIGTIAYRFAANAAAGAVHHARGARPATAPRRDASTPA